MFDNSFVPTRWKYRMTTNALVLISFCLCGSIALYQSGKKLPMIRSDHDFTQRDFPPTIKLVVFVIASQDATYKMHWSVWRRLQSSHKEVSVWFLLGSERSTKVNVYRNNHTVVFPFKETLTPGILDKTVGAMDMLLQGDSKRNVKYILRTNFSSMWQWQRYLDLIDRLSGNRIYAGVIPFPEADPFVSGAGILFSRDAIELLVSKRGDLDRNHLDDVAIGKFFREKQWSMTPLHRCDYVNDQLPAPLDNSSCYHYRTKNSDRVKYDGYLMSRLFFELYP